MLSQMKLSTCHKQQSQYLTIVALATMIFPNTYRLQESVTTHINFLYIENSLMCIKTKQKHNTSDIDS